MSDSIWSATLAVILSLTADGVRTVLFETGSSQLILPGSNCTTCTNLTVFDATKSDTFSPLPGTEEEFILTKGRDSVPLPQSEAPVLGCRSVHDRVSLGWDQLMVDNQSFALCDEYDGAMGDSTISGVMGMGIWDPSANNTPWYWNLVKDGQLESPLFSLYIPPENLAGGQVTLGGIDESKIEGDIHWTNLSADGIQNAYAYVIEQSAIYANGKSILQGNKHHGSAASRPFGYAFLDTSAAFMQTPDYDTAKIIYARISPNITQIDPAGAWGAPCDQMEGIAPDLTFTLGTKAEALNLTIPKRYFNLGEYPGQPGICQAIFNNPVNVSEVAPDHAGIWIAGSPLLDKYYTVWDGVDRRIGWGKLPGLPGFDGNSFI